MDNSRANNQIQKEKHKCLVFLKSLVHFSKQKFNSQNYLFDLHIIIVPSFEQVEIALVSIMYICLHFPTLSVAHVMLLKMYYIVLCAISLPSKHLLISSS